MQANKCNKLMSKITLSFLILVGLVFTACVPTKDIIYLQKKDMKDEGMFISQVESNPYRVQPNDILNISIKAIDPKLVAMFNIAEVPGGGARSETGGYFDGYNVDDHGNIRVPVLGEVNVLGLTADEIRVKLESLLLASYFYKEADIFVTVKLSGFRYTIIGEIGSSGSNVLYRDKVSVLEAIANAGDIPITGDRKNIVIIRKLLHGTEMHSIDLTDSNVMQSPYYYLQPNDFIYIKPLKQKTWGTGTTGLQSLTTIVSTLSLLISSFFIFKSL